MTPRPVQWARGLLGLVALSHLIVPIVMWAARADLRTTIAEGSPELGPVELGKAVDVAVGSAVVFHVLLLALALWLIVKLPTGLPWVRRLATVSQVLSVVFGFVSWSSSPMFHAVIPVVGLVEVALVVLLWAPRASRAFFRGESKGSAPAPGPH
ncbi:hypothetical protein E1263_03390 [Kribbella antibiotica]|uniref:Uncharacterized protein n=1 Tax=Kribbella antibiotica TaxID=190195 RepID=A0A4R4ZUH2_9ACTN|nr:hypothetical protein [Kribbella antibiotica]TDD62495.1 hypothetical protein E1263_03390 [Kribbella antibiotica]